MTSAVLFVLAVVAGAALLALWLDVRFPSLAPTRLAARLLALLAACLAADVASRAFVLVVEGSVAAPARELLALAVLLPGLTLAFLAGLWLLRSLQSLATR